MNPKWLLPIGLVLGLGLLGVAGATKPLQRVQLWLDQRDSPYTATASALAPIIDCVNRIDRDTRLAYYRMQSPQPETPSQDKFGDRDEPEPRLIQAAVCSQLYTLKLQRQQPGSHLLELATTYADKLNSFTSLADMVEPVQINGMPPNVRQMVAQAMNNSLKGQLDQRGEAYLKASAALRNLLEEEDIRVRPAQLALLESRFGRDLHWHLLNHMIAARQAVNQIDKGVRDASLTPQQLLSLIDTLQQASDASEAFLVKMPRDKREEEAIHLWYATRSSADDYLKALRTLHQDWLDHATPQRLSDDYSLVTRRYDILLSFYNRPARNVY